ncbi:MAG: sugar ABC transporter ATP-binding protein [Clostridiaceae bacterium]|nr:sugar ABC transporter ATP-binding protein [Clostridiaceae bacterium]
MDKTPIIEVKDISKRFGNTQALKKVSMRVHSGEVMGLIGENGSGKSTLGSIISGNLKADEGSMLLHGEKYAPQNSFVASENGVAMIVQEQGTIETITVGANIFAGREGKFVKGGILNRRQLNIEALSLLEKIGVHDIRPEELTNNLSFEDRKLVEVARAFHREPDLFIVDETTTALPQKGREILYSLIKKIKEMGKAVIFITHDIDELIMVCDKVTILKDGSYVTELQKSEMDPSLIKSLMVGREISDEYYRSDSDYDDSKEYSPALIAKNLSTDRLKNVSLEIRNGEILGLVGLSDCGMHELGKALIGYYKDLKGSVAKANGVKITNTNVAIKEKIAYVSKDRDSESLLLSASIKNNINLPYLDSLSKFGFYITQSSENKHASFWSKKLDVKCSHISQPVLELSGGNKQKVVLAKWLGNESEIFILDCPTRGIDVGVKESIYHMLVDLKNQGKAILMISEELAEIIGMSDRILTMKDGELTHEFLRDPDLEESDIIKYMI